MNENAMNTLLNKLINIENRLHGIESEFISYVEANPKGDDQWTESRLRVLERTVKEAYGPKDCCTELPKAEVQQHIKEDDQYALRVSIGLLKKAFEEGKQVHDADLKRVGQELKTLHKYIADDRKQYHDYVDHSSWNEKRVDGLVVDMRTLQERDTQTRMMMTNLLKEMIGIKDHEQNVFKEVFERIRKLEERQSPEKYNG